MLKNYFAANFRTLVRQKGTAFINIVCLSTGISACLLFLLWTGDKIKSDRSLYITFALGFFILATACLNYIHLATARFLKRSKETALRKALGASNIKLTMQFLSESFLHILAALIFSMFITEACLSFFNFFPGKSLSLAAFHNGTLIIAILGIIIVVGLLTGIIPAIFMLRLKTIPSLKMVYKNNRLNSGLRNILVIFQFTVAIIFFICTLIMSDQLLYPEIKNIGLIDKNTFIFAAVVEIILSCLSLLGLIIFNAEKRTREIGIRKALGSSIRELNALLLKDFMAWIMVANALAWPIAWYAMKQWLQNFAYRVHFSPLHFLLAGFIIFVAAMLTVIYKTIKTASADPVESLKEING